MTDNPNTKCVSVIGLGKLGAPIAATFASKGHRVIGVDTNADTVSLINGGRAPVFEPGLEEILSVSRERLAATKDYKIAIDGSEITFIVVPTPSHEDGSFSLGYILETCEHIGEALQKKAAYHLVVLASTVLPGNTDDQVRPLLEARSGKRCGLDFGLCYNPAFIALGSAIRGLLNPDFILIGESDHKAGELLASFYSTVCENGPPIARMNIVNAELTKLSVNTYVTTKISFANMLARICERIPGAEVDTVTAALGLDTRIGTKYLKGALGYGGPCFPRDNAALNYLARQLYCPAVLAEATDQVNRQQVPFLVQLVRSLLPEGGQVGILGMAYKPNTDVCEESQGLELARALAANGISVVVYDPASMESARKALSVSVSFASTAGECAEKADVLIVATPWEQFRDLDPRHLKRTGRRPVVVDCWRIMDAHRFEAVAEFVALGVGR